MAFDDDEEPPASGLGISKALVTLKEPTYSRDDVALTADEVTVVLEVVATSSMTVREGLDLVAVVDVSTDMQAERLAGMKKAMQFVILKLTPVNRFSIVSFSDSATRHCPLRSVTQVAKADLRAIVESLVVGGGANIQAGLDTALAVIAGRTTTRARIASIFLMSDGRQNYNTDARRSDSGKVAIHTFRFGKDADYRLLSDVARSSLGGTYSSVPDGHSFAGPFAQQLGSLHTVVAQDAQLTLTPKTDEPGTRSPCSWRPGRRTTRRPPSAKTASSPSCSAPSPAARRAGSPSPSGSTKAQSRPTLLRGWGEKLLIDYRHRLCSRFTRTLHSSRASVTR